MIGRRGLLGLLGLAAIGFSLRPAAAGVETAIPPDPQFPAFGVPRGVVVEMLADPKCPAPGDILAPARCVTLSMISDGRSMVLLESDEGQRIYNERRFDPVNVRGDGNIRHRQHHPVDFPPRR